MKLSGMSLFQNGCVYRDVQIRVEECVYRRIRKVSLFHGCPYFRVSLFQGCPYFMGALISGGPYIFVPMYSLTRNCCSISGLFLMILSNVEQTSFERFKMNRFKCQRYIDFDPSVG